MVAQNIGSTEIGDMKNTVSDFSVKTLQIDGATGQKKTFWINDKFNQYHGYYKTIPELKSTIDTKEKCVMGKGFTANKEDKKIIEKCWIMPFTD